MNNLKPKLILFGILVAVGVVLFWLYGHSFMTVSVPAAKSGSEISYTLVDENGERTEYKTSETSIKKLVPRSTMQVIVKQGETSFIASKKTSGFLSNTAVEADLRPEKKRSFFGNNPNPCMYLVSNILASTLCGGSVDELKLHIPATKSEPTYTLSADGPAATLEGVVRLGTTDFAVVSAAPEDEGDNYHAVYKIDARGFMDPRTSQTLNELDGVKLYAFVVNEGGVLAYDTEGSEVWQFSSFDANPKRIALSAPKDAGLKFGTVSVSGKSILVAYSSQPANFSRNFDNPDGETVHAEDSKAKSHKSEFVIYQDGRETNRVELDKAPVAAQLCASKLCVLTEEAELEVYTIAGHKLNLEAKLSSILAIRPTARGLLLVKQAGVFAFDVGNLTGFMEYSFGGYAYCGLQSFGETAVVCVRNDRGERSALRIDSSQANTDSIDKKILGFQDFDKIKNLSVYGSILYVTPNVGELIFTSDGYYDYDSNVRRTVNKEIRDRFLSSGIDSKAYTLISTVP